MHSYKFPLSNFNNFKIFEYDIHSMQFSEGEKKFLLNLITDTNQ